MAAPPRRLWIALIAWLGCAALFFLAAAQRPGGVAGLLSVVLDDVAGSPWGWLLLLAIYLVRPLLLLPVTILTAFCGYLYGPWLGLAVGHTAALLSAVVGYLGARLWLGLPDALPPLWAARLRRRSFETILVSRLAFVPGDLVNAAAGGLAVPLAPFVGATLLGGLPGTSVGVLAGAAMTGARFEAGGVPVRPAFVVASLVLAALSLLLASVLRRRGAGERS